MPGHTRVTKSNDAIFVRFQNVGERQRFDVVMDRFNSAFPLKNWDGNKRAWQLRPQDLDAVVAFSKAMFGPHGCLLQEDSITAVSFSQRSLGLF